MPTFPEDVDRRLTDLEIKASFAEDLVDELNRLVARQQHQIERLERELGELRRQSSPLDSAAPRNLRDDMPPHY